MSELRYGFSTGACATALAVAAWRRFAAQQRTTDNCTHDIPVLFGDGVTRVLQVEPDGEQVRIVKDAGDDPDCTHRAVLYGRFYAVDEATAPAAVQADSRDYTLRVGEARVQLHAVEGIGLCTRPGLDCDAGKWAINTGPRRMITEHLLRENLPPGRYLFALGIVDGATLAKKTLNARLGVEGGLSVLGTTGLVRPYSHDAWIATVRLCARALRAEGGDTLVLCTGGRTTRGARALLGLPDNAFVSMGDFLAESLLAARDNGIRSVVVACMPGKLCKYAAGFANTHAHRVPQDMALLARETAVVVQSAPCSGLAANLATDVALCASVREALLVLPESLHFPLLLRLARLALDAFRAVAPDADYRLLVFDFEGRPLLDSATCFPAQTGVAA